MLTEIETFHEAVVLFINAMRGTYTCNLISWSVQGICEY